MALTPLFDARDVIIDLQATLPGEEVASHQEIIEGSDTNKAQQLSDGLRNDRVLQVVRLHGAEDAV